MLTKQKNLKALLGTAAFALLFGSSSVYAAGNTGGTSGTSGTTASGASSGAQTSGASASSDSKSSVGKMSQADEKLMKELAAANMAEMKAAQIALDKSKDDQVQKFAQKMLEDHTKAHDKVRDLAQVKNVNLPNELDNKHQSEIKKLNDLSGDKFDKKYLQQGGVSDHKQALQLLDRIEKNAKDPQLKAMATDMRPTIRDHHEMATNLVKGNAATTSGSSGSSSGSSSSSGASPTDEKKAGSAGLTGRPPANNVELGNKAGSGTSGSSSGSSGGSAGTSKGADDKVIGPTRANDAGVMDSKNSRDIRKGTESSSGSSATTGK